MAARTTNALAALGGLLGLGVCGIVLRIAPALIPAGLLPPAVVLTSDVRVVSFCTAVALLAGLLFGIVPLWHATGSPLSQVLAAGGRGATRSRGSLRGALVAGEVAAAVMLLCGAGLLLRTIAAMANVDPGHRSTDVLTIQPSLDYGLPTAMFKDADALRQFFAGVEREVTALPGVESAGWGNSLPMMGSSNTPFTIVGDQSDDAGLVADRQLVSPGYLPALGVPIVAGRGFTASDTAAAPMVCLVSEAVVRQYFGGRNPIGQRIAVPGLGLGRPTPIAREIVGVVADVRRTLGAVEEARSIYLPMAQSPWSFVALVVKPSGGRAEALVPIVRAAMERVDRRVPITQWATLNDRLWELTARPRFRAALVTTFAGLALALTMVGVFGALAYFVQQRTREFGVRRALGATTGDVLRLVFGAASRLIGSGVLLGLVLAGLLTQTLTAFLFQVRPLDPVTFATASVVLVLTAGLAVCLPALRASRVDPLVTFRNDA